TTLYHVLYLSLCVITSLFFFYCAGAHRDLHSFPTRRSSDLVIIKLFLDIDRKEQKKRFDKLAENKETAWRVTQGDLERNARYDEDRKSTRLNSSHVSISYAVFCLKKKTKQNKQHTTSKSNAK